MDKSAEVPVARPVLDYEGPRPRPRPWVGNLIAVLLFVAGGLPTGVVIFALLIYGFGMDPLDGTAEGTAQFGFVDMAAVTIAVAAAGGLILWIALAVGMWERPAVPAHRRWGGLATGAVYVPVAALNSALDMLPAVLVLLVLLLFPVGVAFWLMRGETK